jgi:hypothetical protein
MQVSACLCVCVIKPETQRRTKKTTSANERCEVCVYVCCRSTIPFSLSSLQRTQCVQESAHLGGVGNRAARQHR